jgi:thiazole/oxazole-forming peptide maturase SagC family component
MIFDFDVIKDDKNFCYQLRTKNTLYALEFEDSEKEDVFVKIIEEFKKNNTIKFKTLINKITTKKNHSKVIDVLKNLNDIQLLPIEYSNNLNKNNKIGDALFLDSHKASDTVISVFGDVVFGNKIKELAKIHPFKKVNLYTIDNNVNIEEIVEKSNFIIADATEWSPFHLEEINRSALEKNIPWLYVGGVEETSIKVGPLFYGKETGCYNCLISRIKSHCDNLSYLNTYEEYLRKNKIASKPDIVPNKSFLINIMANMALLEVLNFLEIWSLPVTWKTVLTLDLVTFETTKHKLLKKPFCEICKPKLLYNPSPWLEPITLK